MRTSSLPLQLILTLSTPPARVEHQPALGLLQLRLQPVVFALQLLDLLLPLLQHPQPGIEVEQTLRSEHTVRASNCTVGRGVDDDKEEEGGLARGFETPACVWL